ncbi:hypothetical protein BU23DRAFT_295103 [Bimuria novae-zelandiae CBS 107.79]|uniref:NUDE domain-containing protein n=1 Tax=Bimuria novae-zelandiae CBS 107.79 TaxID=1447943 RepID=A0A6A5VR31_9PLEO|nr:hypothetical protein BU23DRAFT_295103 [Bimuria novae-zelandiae CBS 107.79]
MTTPNRRPGRASLPFTPTSTEPSSRDRIDSFAEPRSELLRHALDAKRVAQTTPTPTPTEPRQVQSETLRKTISDPWLDNAKDEEDVTKTTPVRRHRRPSEGAMPRMRTQRELQAENDSLKNAQMDLKIRLEALQNQHNKALDRVEEYQGRIEELEQYEDEVFDLRDENSKLIHKVQGMEYELTELRDTHEEILKISEETVAEMEKKEEALQEAAEIILGLEKDKAGLLEEVEQLRKTRVPKLQTEAAYNTDAYVTANEQPGYPARVHSIDESRPSTGYHDSDYYSMPASPHDKISQESMITVSERAKKFINMKQETKQSIKDLTRRLSNASLKQSKKKPEVVPQDRVVHPDARILCEESRCRLLWFMIRMVRPLAARHRRLRVVCEGISRLACLWILHRVALDRHRKDRALPTALLEESSLCADQTHLPHPSVTAVALH